MNANDSPDLPGRVASLHLHPTESGAPLVTIESVELVAGRGIRDDSRYFGRLSRETGQPTRRQVTLIEREQIAEHAAALCLPCIPPGAVRSNIETTGRAPERNGSGFSESAMNWRVWPRVVVEAAGSGIDTGLPALDPGWSASPPPRKGRLLATTKGSKTGACPRGNCPFSPRV